MIVYALGELLAVVVSDVQGLINVLLVSVVLFLDDDGAPLISANTGVDGGNLVISRTNCSNIPTIKVQSGSNSISMLPYRADFVIQLRKYLSKHYTEIFLKDFAVQILPGKFGKGNSGGSSVFYSFKTLH